MRWLDGEKNAMRAQRTRGLTSIAVLVCLCAELARPSALDAQKTRAAIDSPSLELVDSIILRETDSLFVGSISGFAVSPEGRIYVSDRANVVVHEYSPTGAHLRTIGRRGRGPGEFATANVIAVSGDSLLAVFGGGLLHLFDLTRGKHKWSRLPASPLVQTLKMDGSRILTNVLPEQWDPGHRRTLASVRSRSDAPAFGGALPAPLGTGALAIDQLLSFLDFALFDGDSVVEAVAASSDYLFIGRFAGDTFDSIHVSRLRRHGAPSQALLGALTRDPRSVRPDQLYHPSVPWGLARLSSGAIAYVTFDPTMVHNRIVGPIYASVVELAGRRTCPDALIPVPTDPQPRVAFSGDTLFVISQDETPRLQQRTMVRKYLLHTEGCRWLS